MNQAEKQIEAKIIGKLLETEPGSDEYLNLLVQLKEAKAIRSYGFSIYNNTAINAVASIVTVVLMMNHERLHVFTTRALSHVPKLSK